MNVRSNTKHRTSTLATTSTVKTQKTFKSFLKGVLLRRKRVKKTKKYLDLIQFWLVMQRRILNLFKYLRWNFLRIYLTAENC